MTDCTATSVAKQGFEPRLLRPERSVLPLHYSAAGETGIEPATIGFGDRCSTVEPLP